MMQPHLTTLIPPVPGSLADMQAYDPSCVVVTGMGMVTPLGRGVDAVWQSLLAGHSGIRPITSFDVSSMPSRIAGQVPGTDQDFCDVVPLKEHKRMGRFILLAMVAAHEALTDAQWLPQDDHSCQRTGVLVGSGIGGLPEIEKWSLTLHNEGAHRVSPFFVPASLINLASGQVSIRYGFRGPNVSVVTACSSGAHAIGEAARLIRSGLADVVVAGGAEAAVCPIGVAGFSAMKALSTHFNNDPTCASRPWDSQRDGFVIAEGAGILVLESLAHARARQAPRIYARLCGYGASGDAYHIAAPREDGAGAERCMQAALADAGLSGEAIGYVNAHGTSTPPGDVAELRAMERLFPEGTLVSSTKSSIGHLLGAAGAVEAIFSIKSLESGHVPATLNLHDPEPTTMDLVAFTPRMHARPSYVLSNSFGFGGTNASLIFGSLPD